MSLNSQVKIILIETTNSGNIGSTLRAMKTMDFSQLVLVNPKNFPSDEALAMSANASDLLKTVKVVSTLSEALEGINFVVATSSRMRRVPWPCESLEEASPKIIKHSDTSNIAIMFGREDRGLTNEELQRSNLHISIPANPEYPVLNLAMSVQVVCYQLYLDKMLQTQASQTHLWDVPKAKSNHINNLINHFIDVAEQLEVYNKGNPRQIGARIKRLFTRVGLDEMEVNFLRGFLSSIEKKIEE
ncbi:MAG: RNA methyltransferase [Proteobacteria bacterium]|nr:RNA methyltransferase [Pseudomonadota bacterium]MDA1056835.1 RNA methyltransferase [Pseudomonadota bacterium]